MASIGVGLLLHRDRAQMAAVTLKRGAPVVTAFSQEAYPSADPIERLRVVKRALATVRLPGGGVRVGLPAEETMVRYMVLPMIPKSEWSAAIQFEVRKYLPFPLKELVWHFYARPNEPAKQLEVVFAAVRKDLFLTYQQLARELGVKVEGMEPAPFGLARTVGLLLKPPADETLACLNVAGAAATIVFVCNQVPLLVRDVVLASGEEALKPPPESPSGAAPPETAEHTAPATIEPHVQILVHELHMSLEYFKRYFPRAPLTRVVLCGDASLHAWVEPLQAQLQVPVRLVEGLATATRGSTALSSEWTAAVGVALGQVLRAGPEVLLSLQATGAAIAAAKPGMEQVREMARDPALVRLAIAEAAIAGLVLWGCALLFGQEARRLSAELTMLRQEARARDAAHAQELPETLSAQLAQTTSRIQALEGLVGQERALATPILEAVAQQQEDGVWLTGLSLHASQTEVAMLPQLLLSGFCYAGDGGREFTRINAWRERISQDARIIGRFNHVEINSLRREQLPQHSVTSFALTCSVKKGPS